MKNNEIIPRQKNKIQANITQQRLDYMTSKLEELRKVKNNLVMIKKTTPFLQQEKKDFLKLLYNHRYTHRDLNQIVNAMSMNDFNHFLDLFHGWNHDQLNNKVKAGDKTFTFDLQSKTHYNEEKIRKRFEKCEKVLQFIDAHERSMNKKAPEIKFPRDFNEYSKRFEYLQDYRQE